MAATKETQGRQKDKPLGAALEAAEGLVLDADYAEDRPISLLAERQREFQKSMQGQFVDTEEAHTVFLHSLLEQGVIPFIPEGRPGPPPRPIPVRGLPVSETIIEERG